MAKSVAAAALVTFTLALYLGYGMMLGFPVRFLPTFQIREAVVLSDWFYPEGLMVAADLVCSADSRGLGRFQEM